MAAASNLRFGLVVTGDPRGGVNAVERMSNKLGDLKVSKAALKKQAASLKKEFGELKDKALKLSLIHI